MKQRISLKIAIPVMAVILIILIVLKAGGYMNFSSGTKLGFVGNSTGHTYSGRYSRISGTFGKTLSPSKDSKSIHCEIHTESGSIHVLITDAGTDEVLFDSEISSDEQFDLEASSKVKIKITTSGHKGSYLFKY